MQLLSVREAKANLKAYGLDLSGISDVMLYRLIEDATDLLNSATHGTLIKTQITNESHVIKSDQLIVDLFNQPIRTVLDLSVFIGAYGGKRWSIVIRNAPNEVASASAPYADPPVVEGDVIVDRTNNIVMVQLVYPAVGFLPIATFKGYEAYVTYTAGYDDGTVQDDGIALPAPSWVRRALMLQLRHMVLFVNASLQGVSEIETTQIGQVKENIAAGAMFDVAPGAQRILSDQFNVYEMA